MIAADQCRLPETPRRRMSTGHARRLMKCRRRLQRERRALARRLVRLRQAWHGISERRRGLERLEKQIARMES